MYPRWMALFLPVLGLLSCSTWLVLAQTVCPTIPGSPTCVCRHPGGDINLTPLAYNNGTPRFTGLEDRDNYIYSYNPCYPYSEQQCQNVYICQSKDGSPNKTSIATKSGGEKIYIDSNEVYLEYNGGDNTANVRLHCNQSLTEEPIVTTLGDSGGAIFVFDVYSCHACPGGCLGGGGGGAGGVAAGVIGIVIIVLFIAGVAAYFIVGAIVLRVKYEASGRDLIINKAFWLDVPYLIKDGVRFTFSPCVNYIRGDRKGYIQM